MSKIKHCLIIILVTATYLNMEGQKKRTADYGIRFGILNQGKNNAITDVPGVKVGHVTLIEGDSVNTGVTAIVPHSGNIFQNKVPAAVFIGNGFGKLTGFSQVEELGNIETPIILTNTLSVPVAAGALIDYTLSFPENKSVMSLNPVVGETNDAGILVHFCTTGCKDLPPAFREQALAAYQHMQAGHVTGKPGPRVAFDILGTRRAGIRRRRAGAGQPRISGG